MYIEPFEFYIDVCWKAKPEGELPQTATSTLYALLNEITHNNREAYTTTNGAPKVAPTLFPAGAGLESSTLNEKERQQICVNALSGIIGIAKHLEDDTVGVPYSKWPTATHDLNPQLTNRLALIDLWTGILHVDFAP